MSYDGFQGGSYIETCNLDGETNLKIKKSLTVTREHRTAETVWGTVVLSSELMIFVFQAMS